MTKEIADTLFALQNAIKNDQRYINFVNLEKMVLQNDKVKEFSSALKETEESYANAVSQFGINSEQATQAQKILSYSKFALDSLNEMSDYNNAFIAYNDLMRKIDDLLFSDFKKTNMCKECHD